MKTYTKEWYLITELKRVWWWFREESDVHLMPILDGNIPRLPDEMQISAAPCFPGKPKTETIIRVVPVASAVPFFEYYSNDEPEPPMQSLEKDVQCTLINRMLLFEGLPDDIKKKSFPINGCSC